VKYKFGDIAQFFFTLKLFWRVMKEFEVFEHTADVGIRAYGSDLNSAFANAAKGMFSIITDLEKVKPIGEYKVDVSAQDEEQLLVDWLSELLYIHSVSQKLFSKFQVNIQKEEGKWRIYASACGEDYQSENHPYHTEIKAVTHHILEIKKDDGYMVQVLFDI
jgi:SHS2 domain-containing protein